MFQIIDKIISKRAEPRGSFSRTRFKIKKGMSINAHKLKIMEDSSVFEEMSLSDREVMEARAPPKLYNKKGGDLNSKAKKVYTDKICKCGQHI